MGKETLLSPESTLQPGNRNPRAGIWHIMVVIHTFASRGSLYMHSKHSHMKGLEDSETKCVCSKHWRFPGLHFNLGVWKCCQKHNCMSPKAECHSLCPAKPHTDYNSLQRQHNTHSWVSRGHVVCTCWNAEDLSTYSLGVFIGIQLLWNKWRRKLEMWKYHAVRESNKRLQSWQQL